MQKPSQVATLSGASPSGAAPSPRFVQPVETLRLLRAVVAMLHGSARSIESTTGVTNAQLFLLRQIGEAGPLSVTELAGRVGARQNAVSPVLRRLTTAGLVAKIASPDDARRAELTVTPAGRRMLRRAPEPPTEVLLESLATLSPVDQRSLASGLRALSAALGLDPGSAPMLFESQRPKKRTAARRVP